MDINNMDLERYKNEGSVVFSDDEDLDFAIASSLQSHFERETNAEYSLNQVYPKDETYLKKLDEDLDYALALSLQSAYNEEIEVEKGLNDQKISLEKPGLSKPLSIVDGKWEMIDPHPDIYALFQEYNKRFFYGALESVTVSWSKRMTLCAGVCSYEGRGGFCSIRLSMPLLKLRPRKDLIETLLHEMIHAYLFVTHNWRDRGDHGPKFLKHMHRINKESGSNITVYHSFHDEVDHYRQHVWQCDGPCRHKSPFYGKVKRAMNRAPGPNDTWWADHQRCCGGKFTKIKEPDNYKNNKKSSGSGDNNKKAIKRKQLSDSANSNSHSDIRSFLKDEVSSQNPSRKDHSERAVANISTITSLTGEDSKVITNSAKVHPKTNFVPFQGTGFKLGGSSSEQFGMFPFKSSSSGFGQSNLSSAFAENKDGTYSKLSKFPRNPALIDIKSAVKVPGSVPSISATSNNTPKKLIQSPMDKYLSPPQSSNSGKQFDRSDSETSLKITCPLCFLQFKRNEINSHVDKCLSEH